MIPRNFESSALLNHLGTSVVFIVYNTVDWLLPASAEVSQKEQMDCYAFITTQWVVRYDFY